MINKNSKTIQNNRKKDKKRRCPVDEKEKKKKTKSSLLFLNKSHNKPTCRILLGSNKKDSFDILFHPECCSLVTIPESALFVHVEKEKLILDIQQGNHRDVLRKSACFPQSFRDLQSIQC